MNSEYIDTSEFQFKGKHAEYVSRLTSEFDKNKFKVFNRNIDVLIFSSIVGFLYNRRAEIDNNNEIRPVKINFQQLLYMIINNFAISFSNFFFYV